MRLRFAPSPTGYIHVGNVRTALFNFLHSKKHNGKFILRIEDTDIERSTKEYEESLLKSIKWLGLSWDEGPDVDGEFGPYRQSERTDIYKKYALKLMEEGKAYYCFCTPEELEVEREKARKAGQPYKYSGKCRNIPPEEGEKRVKNGEKAVIRFKMPQEKDFKYKDLIRGEISFDLNLFGDFVIIRSNGLPSYNYAVVIDDHFMKITDIIRGEDHISNTPKQIKLYEAFGWTPPNFGHLSMVLGPDGSPLSKRHGATSLIQFDEMGYLPEALLNYLAMLGWAPPEEREILTLKELIELFDITKVSKSGAIFDYNKLNWVNRKHIQALSEEELIIRGERFLKD
jgi:glutamyl-tRNA synthetase